MSAHPDSPLGQFEYLRYSEVHSIVSSVEFEMETSPEGLLLQVTDQRLGQRLEIITAAEASAFLDCLAAFIQSAPVTIGISGVYARDGEYFELEFSVGEAHHEYAWEARGDGYAAVLPLLTQICKLALTKPHIPDLSEADLPLTNKERRQKGKKN